jgi:hypothetical protein
MATNGKAAGDRNRGRRCHPGSAGAVLCGGANAVLFLIPPHSTLPHHMSNAARPLPSIPKSDDSLDVGQTSSPAASTPSIHSLFDDCLHPSEGRSLRSSASLPTVPPTANVQFAPLPEINPRERRSTRPLGMAARSQMLQQRRQIRMQNGQRHPRQWSDPDDRPPVYIEEEEDPLESFVQFIAEKSKSLWKRVTSKAKHSDEDEGTGIAGEAAVVEGDRGLPQSRPLNREGSSEDDDHQARGISKK